MYTQALKFYSSMLALTNAPRDEKERGQGTLEYVGIVIIAAALVLALVKVVDADAIAGKVGEKIQDILGAE